MLQFSRYRFAVERQPLSRPFHFKGSYFTEKWINVVGLTMDGSGNKVTGIGGNAVLWSDPRVFREWSEYGGNSLMSLLAERAVQIASESSYSDPIEAFNSIRSEVHEYARRVTGRGDVTPTFSLNAMVALDFSLWKAYAIEQKSERLMHLLPTNMSHAFCESTENIVRVPLISYNIPIAEVLALVHQGHHVLKIKLGQSGSDQEMLEKDIHRLSELHRVLEHEEGPILYYLDANGRYPDLVTMQRLLDAADRIGALSRIILLEEPFDYDKRIAVDALPVRIAADESLHDISDLEERVDLGYRALALKPAGKSLSFTVQMAAKAAKLNIPCFVADSACVPMLLEWNLAFASLLPDFPGIGSVMIESNGAQNYGNWTNLMEEHPYSSEKWLESRGGYFHLDGNFSECSGGIFRESGHYEKLVSVLA
jgi:hypothetical protein